MESAFAYRFCCLGRWVERDDDFAWCFNALKKGRRLASDSDYSPNCLIADNTDVISNGFRLCMFNSSKQF